MGDVERYQLIIFVVVVVALLVLGFFFGRWLRGLLPTADGILDAIGAAWDRFVAWISRPFNPLRGGTFAESGSGGTGPTGIYSGAESIDVSGPSIADHDDATWCESRGLPSDCLAGVGV